MKRALIITGQGFQDHEVIYPYYRLKGDDFEVDIAAKNKETLFGILGLKIDANLTYEDMKIDNYQILILPGGVKALEKVRQEEKVIKFIKEWNDKSKIIASICHGAQLLISAKIIKGKNISGYYSIKDDIINAGANYIDAPFVISKNIITCPHYKYLGEWMNEALKQLSLQNDKKN